MKRRGGDSNPRYGYPYTAFPVLLLQPLGHLSRWQAGRDRLRAGSIAGSGSGGSGFRIRGFGVGGVAGSVGGEGLV